MTLLMQQAMQQASETSNTCFLSCDINWPLLAVLLQILTLAYVAYGFTRTTRNETRLEEYLKRMLGKNEE